MKPDTLVRCAFLLAFLLAGIGWGTPAQAQQRAPMLVTEPAVSDGTSAPAVRGGSTEYLYDDGDGDTNQGPPSAFDPDMLWGNYFLTEPGGEVITEISVAFGPTFPSLENGPVTFWLLDDPDMDFDPLNATALVSVEATPDVFNDNFFTVQIPPTEVSGAFFVGASALLEGGEDRPARVDTGHPGDRSWFCYAPDISEVIDDLASAPYCSRQDGPDVVFPGAFMIRATGVPGGGGEGELVFEPSPLVAMLESGETGTETVTITNTSGTPVEYVFSGYADPDRPAERQAATPDAGMASWHGAKTERDPRHGSAVRFGEGGPDAFGYTWIDSNEPGGPTADAYADISAEGTALTWTPTDGNTSFPAADEGYADVDLPFSFSYYGTQYDALRVYTNGFVTFDQTYTDPGFDSFSNQALPDPAPPNAALYPFWDDLSIEAGAVYVLSTPSEVIIQYEAGRFSATTPTYFFQIVLSPSGAIEYRYGAMSNTLTSATVGIENADGTDGLQVAFNAAYVESGLTILFSATPPFVTDVEPASGTIPAGGSVDVAVTFDASGLVGGTYEGALSVDTDFESEPSTFELPVVLEVSGEAACVLAVDEFGPTIIGTTSEATATVTNDGTDTCELTAASADGPFSVEGFEATTLGPGQSVSFTVVYEPTEAGFETGTLVVETAGENLVYPLMAEGLDQPTPEVEPTALTVEVEVGQTTSQTFTLSNVGGENAADLDYEISVVAARPAGANGVTLGTSHVTLDLSRPAREAVFSSSHLNRITEAPALPAEQRLVDVVARGGGEIAVVVLTPDNQTGTPDPPTNLVNDLNAFPDVTATMYADPLASITAADLAPYDVVVLSNNQQWAAVGADVSVGDALADYIDEGGKVITFAFANDNVGWELAGRFISEGYSPFTMSTGDLTGSVTMEIVEPDHPIAEGVGTISNTGLRMNLQVRPEATLIANWTGGNPAVAHNESVVAFNVLYGALVQWTGDLDVMTYNAVVWLADQGPSTVSVSPEEGTVAPGDSDEITVTVDATELEVGTYDFELLIATNDPENATVTVPVTVEVVPVVANEGDGVPTEFALSQNYPNPFAGATTIEYALPEAAHVTITVYDAVGRRIAVLVNEDLTTGYHKAEWDTRGLAAGVYLYRIEAGDYVRTKKMSLVR